MGYEVIYTYHERVDGSYNKEETKTIKKKVGDPFDDVPMEKLASSIMGQLARRDIFVVGVEVFELSKKKVSFRETDNGVVIKNKKFSFDQVTGDFTVRDVDEHSAPNQSQTIIHPHEALSTNQRKELTASGESTPPRKVVDYVVYVPEPQQIPEVAKKGFRLTVDKKYAVHQKQPSMQGDVLTILDDANREIKISDKYFVPGNIQLFADNELRFSETQKQRESGNLFWGGAVSENMPNLRK